jgi:hypothetical protein
MFGGRIGSQAQEKPLSPYEKRARERKDEYARLKLTSYEDQQRHEGRKAVLGQDYRERFTGTWKEAEAYLKIGNQTFWDWFWE